MQWQIQRRLRLLRYSSQRTHINPVIPPPLTNLPFLLPGLTQYSVCTACDYTIPRTAQTQYHSSLGKHLPRAQAQAGDMLFWATGGDCTNKVAHVGIYVRANVMVNAAHTGTPVREQSIWTSDSSSGESICPDAVR